MAYTKTNWVNDSSPYIDAANLNKIEQGIKDAHDNAFDGGDVLATQLTGLIPINGTPLATDSLLVAIGKLKNTADNPSGGAVESFSVPISSGWQANIDETPNSVQDFQKKGGMVLSNCLMLVQNPLTAGSIIATLPVGLRPSQRVKGVGFANATGVFTPIPFYIETNGEFGILMAPTAQYSLFLQIAYFL
ncbi:MAG: hypothetical protein RR282_00525 [Acinetobacter sp.]